MKFFYLLTITSKYIDGYSNQQNKFIEMNYLNIIKKDLMILHKDLFYFMP
jgi:hypothetical protein